MTTQTTFPTAADATAAGFEPIASRRRGGSYDLGHGLRAEVGVSDTSGGHSYGYRFGLHATIVDADDSAVLDPTDEYREDDLSTTVWLTEETNKAGGRGAFSARFQLGVWEAAEARALAWCRETASRIAAAREAAAARAALREHARERARRAVHLSRVIRREADAMEREYRRLRVNSREWWDYPTSRLDRVDLLRRRAARLWDYGRDLALANGITDYDA